MANTDLTIKTGLLYEKQLDDNGNIINRIPMAPKTLSNCVICTQKDDHGNNMTLNDFISKVIAGDYSGDMSSYVPKNGDTTINGNISMNKLSVKDNNKYVDIYNDGSMILHGSNDDVSNGILYLNRKSTKVIQYYNLSNTFIWSINDDGSTEGIKISYDNVSGLGSFATLSSLPLTDSKLTGTLDVDKGGTGKATHTTNAVLTGNGTSPVNNIPTKNGAAYATSTNGALTFGTLPVGQGGTGATTLTSDKILQGNGTSAIKSTLSVDVYNETSGMANSTSDSYIPTSKAVKGYINSEIRTRRVSVDILSGYTNDYKDRTGSTFNYDWYTQKYPAIGVEGSLVPAPSVSKGGIIGTVSNFDYYKLYNTLDISTSNPLDLYNPADHFVQASLGIDINRWHSIYGIYGFLETLTFTEPGQTGSGGLYTSTKYTWNTSKIGNIIKLEIEGLDQCSNNNWNNNNRYSNYGYNYSNSVANDNIISIIAKTGVYRNSYYNSSDDGRILDETYEIIDTSYIKLGGPFIDITSNNININTDNFNLTGTGIHISEDDYNYTMHVCKIYNTIIVSGEIELTYGNLQTIDIPFPNSILSLLKYHGHIDNNPTDAYKFTCSFEKYSYGLSAYITGYNNSANSKVPVIHVIGITGTNTMYFTFITNG